MPITDALALEAELADCRLGAGRCDGARLPPFGSAAALAVLWGTC